MLRPPALGIDLHCHIFPPEYLRLARMTAAGLASRMGFTYDEVEDLRIAIDEVCFSMVGTHGRSGTITVHYTLDDGELAVEGTGHFSDGLGNEPVVTALSKQILSAVVDECELSAGEEGPRFRLIKRHRST